VLVDALQGANVRGMLDKMHQADRDEKLPIRDPGDQLPKVIAEFHRDFFNLVKVSDVDAGLTHDGVDHLLPLVAVAEPQAALTAAPETPKQRRARLLRILDAEPAVGPEHGDLNAHCREGKLSRPPADRSNIGMDIKEARKERDEERRGGELSRLLGG